MTYVVDSHRVRVLWTSGSLTLGQHINQYAVGMSYVGKGQTGRLRPVGDDERCLRLYRVSLILLLEIGLIPALPIGILFILFF
jgi:hypothetical protein